MLIQIAESPNIEIVKLICAKKDEQYVNMSVVVDLVKAANKYSMKAGLLSCQLILRY